MTASLFRVVLPVRGLAAAARVYERLLGLEGEQVSDGRVHLDWGGTILALVDENADLPPDAGHVYFAVAGLEGARERAVGLGAQPDPVETRPRGERSFHVRDPAGNPLCLVEAGSEFLGGRFVP